MDIKDILTLVSVIAGFLLSTLIPTVGGLIVKIRAYRQAKSEAEKQAIINEIGEDAKNFIVDAENLYKDIDHLVKQNGKSCGPVKKDSVMTKIQDDCILKGIAFDKEYWSNYVDNFVAATRQVNAKK